MVGIKLAWKPLFQTIIVFTIGFMSNFEQIRASEAIHFFSDNEKVVGRFFPAEEKPKHTVLLLNGFPGNPVDVLGLGQSLSQSNINVLIFNYRGTFESEGEYGLANSQRDIASALSFMQQPEFSVKHGIDTSSIILGGYSFGGGMALTFASNNEDIKRVFSIAGTDHGEFARRYASDSSYAAIFDDMFKQLAAPNGPVRFIGKDALAELQANASIYDLRAAALQLSKKDLLIVGGLNDPNVTLEEHLLPFCRALKEKGSSSLQFYILQDDHSFSQEREELGRLVETWIKNPQDSGSFEIDQ